MTSPALSSADWAIGVPPNTSSLAEIRRFVEKVANHVHVGPEQTFDLKVAVSEAYANAIEHSGSASEPLEVTAHVGSDRLTFIVRDKGLFRPPSYAREDFSNRGLGLPLMVTLMDKVTFQRTPDGGTRVTLSVRLG